MSKYHSETLNPENLIRKLGIRKLRFGNLESETKNMESGKWKQNLNTVLGNNKFKICNVQVKSGNRNFPNGKTGNWEMKNKYLSLECGIWNLKDNY